MTIGLPSNNLVGAFLCGEPRGNRADQAPTRRRHSTTPFASLVSLSQVKGATAHAFRLPLNHLTNPRCLTPRTSLRAGESMDSEEYEINMLVSRPAMKHFLANATDRHGLL